MIEIIQESLNDFEMFCDILQHFHYQEIVESINLLKPQQQKRLETLNKRILETLEVGKWYKCSEKETNKRRGFYVDSKDEKGNIWIKIKLKEGLSQSRILTDNYYLISELSDEEKEFLKCDQLLTENQEKIILQSKPEIQREWSYETEQWFVGKSIKFWIPPNEDSLNKDKTIKTNNWGWFDGVLTAIDGETYTVRLSDGRTYQTTDVTFLMPYFENDSQI